MSCTYGISSDLLQSNWNMPVAGGRGELISGRKLKKAAKGEPSSTWMKVLYRAIRGETLKLKFCRCPTPRHFHLQVWICNHFDSTQLQPICNILSDKPHPSILDAISILCIRVRRTQGLVFVSLDMSNISQRKDGKWYSAPIVLSREMLRKEPSRFKKNKQWFFWGTHLLHFLFMLDAVLEDMWEGEDKQR